MLEGFLSLADRADPGLRKGIEDEISRIKSSAAENALELRKPLSTADLAREVGCEEEYAALFKFMSKYVHPSSWLVNLPQSFTGADVYRFVLCTHLQIYSLDSYQRVRVAFNV